MALAAVVERMNDPVVVLDHLGRIADLNPAAERLLGRPAHDVLGIDATCVFDEWAALKDRLQRINEQQESRFEIDLSGAVFDASISRLGEGEDSAGWALVLRDVTRLKSAEQERAAMIAEQTARAEAEAANRAKDRFLATLSHELRTPLTPVLATVTAMLGDPSTPSSLRSVLEMIRRNVDLETRLIDDLLDLTRIRRSELLLKRAVIDAHEQIDQVLDICGDDAHNADLTLISQLKAESHHADADPARFQQVLWNLLKNAIKFSPKGGVITIRSRNRTRDARRTGWFLARDRGDRPRHRHRAGDLAPNLQHVRGRRLADRAQVRRFGAWSDNQPIDRRAAWRPPDGRQRRTRERHDVDDRNPHGPGAPSQNALAAACAAHRQPPQTTHESCWSKTTRTHLAIWPPC